jgi:hypothetical protein
MHTLIPLRLLPSSLLYSTVQSTQLPLSEFLSLLIPAKENASGFWELEKNVKAPIVIYMFLRVYQLMEAGNEVVCLGDVYP